MKKIISIQDLSYSIPYTGTIIENLNLDIYSGEFLGILGHNGAGKTTLLDLLNGFRNTPHGKILVLDENPNQIERKHKHKIIFLSQDVFLKGSITIKEFLSFYAEFYPDYSREEQNRLLDVFKLNSNTRIGSLSTGQQKKLQAVAGFSTRPSLVLIDEITAVMDPETRQAFFQELEGLRSVYGTAIVLATNIAEDLIHRANKVFFIEDKKGELYRPEKIIELFNLKKVA